MLLKHKATIKFDPSNIRHREAVHSFMKRRAWVDSPVQFSKDLAYSSIAEQVQTKLLQWYIDQEISKQTAQL